MSKRYGIVYMGSKEKILSMIDYIFQREYKKKTFIDLFTGGFSVSSYALQRTKFNVVSNDLNHYVTGLYIDILNGSENLNIVKYDWISREHFEAVRDNPTKFDSWYVGYVLNVWSFGCNQKDYLYAKDLENDKKALHQAIVFDDFRFIKQNSLFDGLDIPKSITELDFKEYPLKRIAFMEKVKHFIKENRNQPTYDQLRRLEQMENISQMLHLKSIANNCDFKQRLTLHNVDWQELYLSLPKNVLENSFIYCDPPYENTKQYLFGSDFDYKTFWKWFRECPYSVYVSSYTAPADIKPINFTQKQVNLDNGNRNSDRITTKKKAIENIYWNGKGNAEPTFFDQLFPEE